VVQLVSASRNTTIASSYVPALSLASDGLQPIHLSASVQPPAVDKGKPSLLFCWLQLTAPMGHWLPLWIRSPAVLSLPPYHSLQREQFSRGPNFTVRFQSRPAEKRLVIGCQSRVSSVGVATGLIAGIRFLAEATNYYLLYSVQTGSWAHPAYCPVGTRALFPECKAAGMWNWPLTSI
jgi:hypothetical protein